MENVEDTNLRATIIRAEYKEKIEGLKFQYTSDEIADVNSEYSTRKAALITERDQTIAAL
jgi:hypothetical protein